MGILLQSKADIAYTVLAGRSAASMRRYYNSEEVEESYRLSDIDVDHGCCAEGRGASVSGLDDQRPLAVLLLGDVLNYLQGLDVRLELDIPCVSVDFKDVVGVRFHDGVLYDVVRRLCILIHRLHRDKDKQV